ncbi:MAG TPA: FAD-dependent monooxygenase [Polyangiaceae bacterium]|nr:FAD-dependent monooxygenase [Polyangiaceae bacterium]
MRDPSREALVVGAGIGGLAAALALRQTGRTVRVFERAADARQLGFALLLAPNAMAALRALGVADEVRAAGHVLTHGEMRRPNGQVLRRLDTAQVSAALGEESVCVLRPALHGVLSRALGSEALTFGAQVVDFAADLAGVRLEFADGAAALGELLVGADGVGSTVRKALHPGEPPPRRAGLVAVRGVARNAVQHLGEVSGAQYFGPGIEAGVSRASEVDVYWYLCVVHRAPPAPRLDPRSLLDPHLAEFHAPFRALVAATLDSDLRLDDLHERAPLAAWGRGAVSLLGDAAHPMLPHAGQGAAQALEDAVLLGQALRTEAGVEAALRHYERVRIPRTRAVSQLSQRNAKMGSLRHPLGCWLRDLAVKYVPERALLRSLIDLGKPPPGVAPEP